MIAALAAFALAAVSCVASTGTNQGSANPATARHAGSAFANGSQGTSGSGGGGTATTTPVTTLPSSWQGQGTPGKFQGCEILDRSSVFRSSVVGLPVDPRSDAYLDHAGGNGSVGMVITNSVWAGSRPGIPINVVNSTSMQWTEVDYDHQYPGDHFPSPIPLPDPPKVEGAPSMAWDRHVIVFDSDTCETWELISYNPIWQVLTGKPWAAAGAHFNPSGGIKPAKSTTVAGNPILATMIRLDEVQAGRIDHVIGAGSGTTSSVEKFVWPAFNGDGQDPHPGALPMGSRLRLKATTPTSQLTGQAKVIADALKEHGLMIVDSGSPGGGIGFSAENVESGWDNTSLASLNPLLALENFEVVDQSPMMISPDSWAVR